MFAQVRILVRSSTGAVVLPVSAIQRVDGQPLAFVKLADDLYEARAVRLGAKYNGAVEVLDGLKAQEQVVVAHGFAVKSQLLLDRLGAGCAEE
jgi:cobalt-zinc-cadmium efflux system membrane fusion protein